MNLLLQCREFRQIREQTNRPINLFRPAPNRRNRHAQQPRFASPPLVLDLFSAENASLRQAFPNQPRQPGVFPQNLAVSPESQGLNAKHLFRRRIRARNNSRRIHHHKPCGHVPRHFFAQPFRMFRALSFNLVQSFELFLLVAQLPDRSFHRCRHKRRRVFRSRRRHHSVRSLRFLCALKKPAQQKKYDSHHGQDSHRRAGGDFPDVLCTLDLECCERHSLNRPSIEMNLSAISAPDQSRRKKTQTPQSAPQSPKTFPMEGDTGSQSTSGSGSQYQALAGWPAPPAGARLPPHTSSQSPPPLKRFQAKCPAKS